MAPTSLSKSELLAQELQALEANLTQISLRLLARRRLLATAESCTGGMIAAACTDLSGSSQWFERGFVTYSNEAKAEMLGVPPGLIEQHGAVSEPVARARADGALAHSRAQVSLAVTGVAGPTGGTEAKPAHTATGRPMGDPVAAIARCAKPVIGAINGAAVTGGFELALACDVLLASSNARFADTHARIGVAPGWGLSQKLSRAIGPYRAREVSLTGNWISAEQAAAWGRPYACHR